MKNAPSLSEHYRNGEYFAAVDLGSNSFHMVVVHVVSGNVQIVSKIKQKVRLASGLDNEMVLSEESMSRGLSCLETFSERLQDIPSSNIKVVATATLRLARNAGTFIDRAETILNHKLRVISGEEEARQIYLGVAYTSANQGNMLVIDIGGASTEIILGNDMHPIYLRSLDMGCVTVMDRFFLNGTITAANFEQAKRHAKSLISGVSQSILCFDWSYCLGASGTPQAITEILVSRGISDAIRLDYLYKLEQECIACAHIDALDVTGLEESRKAIFPSGLAILIGLFECLQIKEMNISGGALREGLIYGMLDNVNDSDRQSQTLNVAMNRYHIEKNHAKAVKTISLAFCKQLCAQSNVCHLDTKAVLGASALLHEIGLHIEYKRYHKHGAYILDYINLPGFTKLQKSAIRDLVRSHRGKLDLSIFDNYHEDIKPMLLGLVRILRLSTVLCIRRNSPDLPEITLGIKEHEWTLTFPKNWLREHPLIKAELTNETWLQHKVGWPLKLI
ncbi:guanosine-5'-triphosphate,3'-diphosphate pyrophosphatase [Alteromonas sp. 5E99-2]|uniref:Ppx/GppA phosphatase family protein n=1 Tax=Alteromonas sp. 5E99-2 TaxID=2817683 RepID=UPI001A99233D|nr:guanosine-5'-triphosphate,3'-diphosphate pyrophosphatase [Alteromonas sp. 5E99-2]MBO1254593.1 guanosine-5'-triphosphate,3'-diphosphate pyrophosphatase [Alteromonas sp. 5E99-2]